MNVFHTQQKLFMSRTNIINESRNANEKFFFYLKNSLHFIVLIMLMNSIRVEPRIMNNYIETVQL